MQHTVCCTQFAKHIHLISILGQEIHFDFEVDKNAIAGYYSCGGWFNGEYFIIDKTAAFTEGNSPATIRNFEKSATM